jgi:hypothetical protein
VLVVQKVQGTEAEHAGRSCGQHLGQCLVFAHRHYHMGAVAPLGLGVSRIAGGVARPLARAVGCRCRPTEPVDNLAHLVHAVDPVRADDVLELAEKVIRERR